MKNLFLLAIYLLIGGCCVGGGALEVGASPTAVFLFVVAYEAAIWGTIYAVLKVGEKVGLK